MSAFVGPILPEEVIVRRLVVGDVHGCLAELEALLDRAGISDSDEVIALGDLVDRGPDSYGVWKLFRGQPGFRTLLGNHERKHRRIRSGQAQPALSQLVARIQFPESEYAAFCEWVTTLPLFLELEEAIVVHGFLEPGVPIEEQREEILVGTLAGERYLRERYAAPWYTLYDGSKPLIVGHRDYNGAEPFVYQDRVFGVDTKCFAGGALTGLLLPEFRWVSVPSRMDYWRAIRSVCRPLFPLLAGRPVREPEVRAALERHLEAREPLPEPLESDLRRFLQGVGLGPPLS